MISKLLKLFLFLLVALVCISALSIALYAFLMQAPSDHGNVRGTAPTTRSVQDLRPDNADGNFRPSNTYGLRNTGSAFSQETNFRPDQRSVKAQTQSQLDALQIQQAEVRQMYAPDHPHVKRLNAQVKLLKAQLKAEAAYATSRAKPSPEQLELQQKIERAEQDAFKSANLLMNADLKDEESKSSVRDKLKELVQEAFDLRMRLQNAQLDDAEEKLKASRQRLAKRQSLTKQIVDRRVNELLGRDETKWSTQPSDAGRYVSPNSGEGQPARTRYNSPNRELPNWESPARSAYDAARSANANSQRIATESRRPPSPVESARRTDVREVGEVPPDRRPDPIDFPTQPTTPPSLVDPMHRVGPGDVLSISGISVDRPVHVKSDGTISLPFINRFKVAGKTAIGIEEEISRQYAQWWRKRGVSDAMIKENIGIVADVVVQQIYQPEKPVTADRRKIQESDTFRPSPVGTKPPESALAPFALRYEGGSKKPSSLLKRGEPDAEGIPSYEYWAVAEPVGEMQGRWKAKRVSVEGKEVALDSAIAKKGRISEFIVDGQRILEASPYGQESYLFAHPDIPDVAILFEVDDQTKTSLLRFSAENDSLKIAICDVYNREDPPLLRPSDDVSYFEYERVLEYRTKPNPASVEPPSSTTHSESDTAPKPTGPQRTRHGLVYRDANNKYPYAVAVSVSGEAVTLVIVDPDPINEPPNSYVAIRADSVTITHSGGGSSDAPTFVLPAIDTDKKGHSSVFHLENPTLFRAVTQGSYMVSFEDAGEKYVYPIFQDARFPLVPHLQLVEAREWANAEDTTQAVKDDAYRHVLPRSSLWRFPPKRARNRGDKEDTELVARRFAETLIDENDILSAYAKPTENDKERYEVSVTLTPDGARRMTQATKRLLKQSKSDETLRLAILIDGEVVMAPKLNSVLSNSFVITGNFSKAEAEKLAGTLSDSGSACSN